MRDYGVEHPLPGRYTPTCTKEGKFESKQRMGSMIFCVDEETGIPDFTTETEIGRINELDCKKKGTDQIRTPALPPAPPPPFPSFSAL